MEAAITAAETGHLVFGTLHTTGAAKTIDRITNAFPKEQQEMDILSVYLPKQLSDEEIKQEVLKAIESTGAHVKADQGKVMKALMPVLKGKADGQRINQILMGMVWEMIVILILFRPLKTLKSRSVGRLLNSSR